MANPHFGNLGDVWKHVVLSESIARERPRHYWETHAGSASYPLSHSFARDYGVYYLLENGCRTSHVARSTYYEELTRFQSDQSEDDAPAYPGSALLAMRILRDSASYVLCDVDERSARSLTDAAGGLGLGKHVQLAVQDGLAAVRDASHTFKGEPADVLVHIDPFDPCSETQPGLSALSLAADLGASGFKLILWYGYDSPADRALPWAPLATRGGSQWCGDLIIRSNLNGGAPLAMSDISPLIGCGVVATNLRNSTAAALGSLGNDLVSLYEESLLPQTDTPGALAFLELAIAPVG